MDGMKLHDNGSLLWCGYRVQTYEVLTMTDEDERNDSDDRRRIESRQGKKRKQKEWDMI